MLLLINFTTHSTPLKNKIFLYDSVKYEDLKIKHDEQRKNIWLSRKNMLGKSGTQRNYLFYFTL